MYHFVPKNVSISQKKILHNYVHGLGNYEISQKKSSENVFSGTGQKMVELPIYVSASLISSYHSSGIVTMNKKLACCQARVLIVTLYMGLYISRNAPLT